MMKRLMCAVTLLALTVPAAAQDKAAEIMKQMREALGGSKLSQLKGLSLEGPFRREMGQRQLSGTMALTLQMPDRMHRSEDTEMMGGMSIERLAGLAGDKAWEDIQNHGGMGGNVQIFTRQGPPGQELNPEQVEQARLRRLRTEFNRYLLAFTGGAGLTPTFVAVAEAPEGKADVLELKNEGGQSIRLFVDQQTHMPLMLQYKEVRPRMMFQGGPGGPGGRGGGGGVGMRGPGAGGPPPGAPPPDGAAPPPEGARQREGAGGQRPSPEEIQRRREMMPPPEPSDVSLYLADFQKVDGVMLPHRLTQSIDGKTVDEWTIEKIKVNPAIKADLFEKK
jgi:hypothetical protein